MFVAWVWKVLGCDHGTSTKGFGTTSLHGKVRGFGCWFSRWARQTMTTDAFFLCQMRFFHRHFFNEPQSPSLKQWFSAQEIWQCSWAADRHSLTIFWVGLGWWRKVRLAISINDWIRSQGKFRGLLPCQVRGMLNVIPPSKITALMEVAHVMKLFLVKRTHTHTDIYIYIHACVCVCVCALYICVHLGDNLSLTNPSNMAGRPANDCHAT